MAEPLSAERAGPKHDPLTIACIGALAFMAASVTHEAVGHGGMALATGGQVVLLTSVYFHATGVGPIVDAAGPLTSLLVGGLLWIWQRKARPASPHAALLLATTMALNLFWGTGYFLYTGISGKGDWAFLFGEADSVTAWGWRGALMAVGLISYRLAIAETRKALAPFAETGPVVRPLGSLAVWLYVAAGATCCLTALAYRGSVGAALGDSAVESFGGCLGLLVVRRQDPGAGAGGRTIGRDGRWVAATAVVLAIYVALMGRGIVR